MTVSRVPILRPGDPGHPLPKPAKGKPTRVDVHVGKRIQMQRTYLGLSLAELADTLGYRYQVVQQYEKGRPVGAGRLFEIAKALNRPVSFFFPTEGQSDDDDGPCLTLTETRAAIAFSRISSPRQRDAIMTLMRSCAQPSSNSLAAGSSGPHLPRPADNGASAGRVSISPSPSARDA